MTVRNLYPEQFEELREKLYFAMTESDLEDIGANTDTWQPIDFEDWNCYNITDELVIKSFDCYDFGIDDFFCTAMKYDEYPDKD